MGLGNWTRRGLGVGALVAVGFALAPRVDAQEALVPTLSFSETYLERLFCEPDPPGPPLCEVIPTGAYRIDAKVPLRAAGLDSREFFNDTPIVLDLDDDEFAFVLADDPKYRGSHQYAKFAFRDENQFGRVVRYFVMNVRWDRKMLRINIQGRTPELTDALLGEDYLGEEGEFEDVTSGRITVDFTDFDFPEIPFTGRGSYRSVTKGGELFDLASVRLNGSGTGTYEPPDPEEF